jgi:hypothetical protein
VVVVENIEPWGGSEFKSAGGFFVFFGREVGGIVGQIRIEKRFRLFREE